MGRASFWQLTHLCDNTPEAAASSRQCGGSHHRIRYINRLQRHSVLGASGGEVERARVSLGIGYGTIWEYT